jgi:hypothetical protein
VTATDIASSNLWVGWAQPFRIFNQHTLGTNGGATVTPSPSGTRLVMGMDVVAAHANPIQCFCEFRVPSAISVFYDSQSTGEGNGVRFTWRGQIPISPGESVTIVATSSGSLDWYITAWGLLIANTMVT